MAIRISQNNNRPGDLSTRDNLPMVGMVVTISPSLSLYKMVVLPAASRPTIKIRISFLPKKSKSFEKLKPIFWNQELKRALTTRKSARGWLSLLFPHGIRKIMKIWDRRLAHFDDRCQTHPPTHTHTNLLVDIDAFSFNVVE